MSKQVKKSLVALPVAALLFALTPAAWAEPGEKADKAAKAAKAEGGEDAEHQRRCLSLHQIRRIEIIDDQTLKFHMRGSGPDYLNNLPYRCSGLKNRGSFMHATSTNDYCDLDIITQIDTTIGMRLGSCPLGEFEAVAREPDEPKE